MDTVFILGVFRDRLGADTDQLFSKSEIGSGLRVDGTRTANSADSIPENDDKPWRDNAAGVLQYTGFVPDSGGRS
jgi:hypothetical protein